MSRQHLKRSLDRCRCSDERVELLEAVVNNFPGGIVVVNEHLEVVFCNDQQKRLLDYPDQLFERPLTLEQLFWFNALRGEYGPGVAREQVRVRLELVRQRLPHRFERRRPDGTVLEIRGAPLTAGGFVTTYVDVTELRRERDAIAHAAHHDALTDLPNRKLFLDRLDQALARVARGEVAALHYIDLDHFKPINDRLGHAAGDDVLKEVAARLRTCVRGTDTAARLGGDEFAIIQSPVGEPANALCVARRVQAALAEPLVISGEDIRVGATIGIAVAGGGHVRADALMERADEALYVAKAGGRGTWHMVEMELNSRVLHA